MERDAGADIDGRPAWIRLAVAVALGTIGGVGMWSVVVVLPAVQAEFGVERGTASLPYTAAMLGFAFGGVVMGRLADRLGIFLPVLLGTLVLGAGYILAGLSGSLWQFGLAHGLMIGMLGSASTFGPLMADISHWFRRRRGIAVAISAAGNYFAGAIWPPIVRHLVDTYGWRWTHIAIGVFCLATMLPLTLMLRRPSPRADSPAGEAGAGRLAALGLSGNALTGLLAVAGFACCVAMSMPQVHIVAYCVDLKFGAAVGADMLSAMLAFGIVSRIASGFVADRIGGLMTLLVGSVLQGAALSLYLAFDGLSSLFVISALFGLFQGGIVPSYAIIVREYFPAREAGTRVGLALMATLFGMAFGGWVSGAIFDWTGSYAAAFVNGLAWNLVNLGIVAWLLTRRRARAAIA